MNTLNEILMTLAHVVINNGIDGGAIISNEDNEVTYLLPLHDGSIIVDKCRKKNNPNTYIYITWNPSEGKCIDLSKASKEFAQDILYKAYKKIGKN